MCLRATDTCSVQKARLALAPQAERAAVESRCWWYCFFHSQTIALKMGPAEAYGCSSIVDDAALVQPPSSGSGASALVSKFQALLIHTYIFRHYSKVCPRCPGGWIWRCFTALDILLETSSPSRTLGQPTGSYPSPYGGAPLRISCQHELHQGVSTNVQVQKEKNRGPKKKWSRVICFLPKKVFECFADLFI